MLFALSDPARLDLVRMLAKDGPQTVANCQVVDPDRAEVDVLPPSQDAARGGPDPQRAAGPPADASLRRAEVDERFPGLLESVIARADPCSVRGMSLERPGAITTRPGSAQRVNEGADGLDQDGPPTRSLPGYQLQPLVLPQPSQTKQLPAGRIFVPQFMHSGASAELPVSDSSSSVELCTAAAPARPCRHHVFVDLVGAVAWRPAPTARATRSRVVVVVGVTGA